MNKVWDPPFKNQRIHDAKSHFILSSRFMQLCLNLFETSQNEFDGGNEWIRCCYVVGGRVIQYMFFVWSFYLFFFSITFSLDALISMFLLHISVYKKVFKFHIHTIQFPLVCVLCLFQKYMLWSFITSY